MESWKIIEGFENYMVSDHGRVKNNKTGRIKNVKANKKGYIRVSMQMNNLEHKKLVHVLVASAFVDNPENRQFVDHVDNCKTNNNITNLRWATSAQNNQNKEVYKNSKSRVKGVCFDKHAKKYKAQITIDGIPVHLGYFTNIEDAKQARMIKANEVFGVFTN